MYSEGNLLKDKSVKASNKSIVVKKQLLLQRFRYKLKIGAFL